MKLKDKSKTQWWHGGIQFECQGSGQCCTSRGEFGFVYFSKKDRMRAAQHLNVSEKEFLSLYCQKVDGAWALKERKDNPDCLFLKDKKCQIYSARPTQCRTWPFWPEVMGAKKWNKAVEQFCPGVGQGRRWTKDEISKVLAEQEQTDRSIAREIEAKYR